MTKVLKALLIVAVIALVGVCGYLLVSSMIPSSNGQFGFVEQGLTTRATTTSSFCVTCPVKILDAGEVSEYAIITNPSDTAIYLFPTATDLTVDGLGGTSATSTITSPLDGIYLAAAGGSYTIKEENLLNGHWFASTTAATAKQINVAFR